MKGIKLLAAGWIGAMVLAASAPAGCLLDQDAGYVKVHFMRTPGVGDFNRHTPVDLDGKSLSADEAKRLRKMIEDAGVFDLKSGATPPYVPDPPAGYDLTVDMDGRTHTIWLADGDVSKSLQPLIDWLNERSKRIEAGNQATMPVKTREEEEPVNNIEYTKS